MSLLTTTKATWSYQLQFNFKFRKPPSPLLFLRAGILSFDDRRRGRLRVHCESKRRSSGNSWLSFNTSSADWLGNSEKSGDSQNNHGIGGILGVGLAGILLVAGITSAALSIGKRSNSRPGQEMEPLTQQQEMLLTSGEEVYDEEENKNDGKFNVQDESNLQHDRYLESEEATENDVSSFLESTEYISQIALVDDTDVEPLSERGDTISDGLASVEEYLQSNSTFPDMNNLETISISPEFPQLESVDGSYVTPRFIDLHNRIEGSKIEENLDVVGLSNADEDRLNTCEQQVINTANPTETSQNTLESSPDIVFPTNSKAPDNTATANATLESDGVLGGDIAAVSVSSEEDAEVHKPLQFSGESNITSLGVSSSKESKATDTASFVAQSSASNQDDESNVIDGKSVFGSQFPKNVFASRGIPAPSLLSAALQSPPGKVLIPAATDQTQAQALTALQVLKVIESDVQPGDLCTRREYARWLVSASSALSRNFILKVYPAMYIENVTELAFDDITPEDPDFTSIQGLAEAGLISSKLSRRDMLSYSDEDIGPFCFNPDSPLSRQDLVTWKMALEKRQLPEADRKVLHQLSGFIDIDRIDSEACPALVADVSAGDQGIVAHAFGYTRLFQPDKPVTKGQAAIALATGERAEVVNEELARIEAESIADKAVAAHSALVAEVEKDINASFEKELLMEREKIDAVQKMAEEARQEVERLRVEREEENIVLMKERAAVESEMEVLSKLRHELEEKLQSVITNKVEISYEKEKIEKLRKEAEEENQAIAHLQYELEVERKALSMARSWAEDEAKRVQEHAKALEEARERWEKQGIKVVVDKDLREEAAADVTWTNAGKQISVEETVERAENLIDKLKAMAGEVRGKSKEIINKIINKIQSLTSAIKEWISKAGRKTTEFRDVAAAKAGGSVEELQQHAAGFGATVKEGARRVAGDWREGVEKLTQRFRT